MSEFFQKISGTFLEWMEKLQQTVSDPNSYMQAGVIFIAIVLAMAIASFIRKNISFFNPDNTENKSKKYSLRWLLYRTGQIACPILALITLGIGSKISTALFGQSTVVDAATRLAFIYLLWVVLRSYVTQPLIRTIGLWILIPAALLHLFGQLVPTLEYLDTLTISLGSVSFSVLRIINTIFAAVFLFWLGRISNYSGQNYIRSRESIEVSTRELFAKLFEFTVYVVIALLLFKTIGLDLSTLAVFGGALGVGLGFGLQKIASNFISGVILLLEKSVRVGDVVELDDGTFGVMQMLGARASVIKTYDGKEVMIPNEDFIVSRVTNYSHTDMLVRHEIPFGVSYNTDLHIVPPTIEAAVSKHRQVLQEPEKVDCELQEFGDSSVNFTVEFWVEGINDGENRFISEIMFLIWDALKENNIEIPFPQRDIHIKSQPS